MPTKLSSVKQALDKSWLLGEIQECLPGTVWQRDTASQSQNGFLCRLVCWSQDSGYLSDLCLFMLTQGLPDAVFQVTNKSYYLERLLGVTANTYRGATDPSKGQKVSHLDLLDRVHSVKFPYLVYLPCTSVLIFYQHIYSHH